MSAEIDPSSDAYVRQHNACQQWAPANVVICHTPSGQEFYVEPGARNTENIRQFPQEAQLRELCPVWKPSLPNSPAIFIDQNPA